MEVHAAAVVAPVPKSDAVRTARVTSTRRGFNHRPEQVVGVSRGVVDGWRRMGAQRVRVEVAAVVEHAVDLVAADVADNGPTRSGGVGEG